MARTRMQSPHVTVALTSTPTALLEPAAPAADTAGYTSVDTLDAMQQLAAGLHSVTRDRPWVIVSTRFGTPIPDIDAALIAREVGDVARVFLIETGDLTHKLSDLLPDRMQVYGGAGRSYRTGPDALSGPSSSKLRFAHDNPERATEQLIADALGHAHAAGLFKVAPASVRAAGGTIGGFLSGGTRALVHLDGGGLATIWQELTYPPVPLEWTLAKGQRVDGVLDVETNRLNVEVAAVSTDDLARRYPHGCVTLALVQSVRGERAMLALHPQLAIAISRHDISANPLDRVETLLSVGDVVAVRVVHLQGGALHVRLNDVDDDEEVLAPLSLVRNGPSWLREGRPLVTRVEIEPVPGKPATPAEMTTPAEAAVAQVAVGQEPAGRVDVPTPSAPARPPRPTPGPGLMQGVRVQPGAPQQPLHPPLLPTPQPAGSALQSTQLALAEAQAHVARLSAQLSDAGASGSQLAQLREDRSAAEFELREALAELGAAQRVEIELRAEQRDLKRMLRDSRRTHAETSPVNLFAARQSRWADPIAWVRHEIYLAWVERIAPTERVTWPLPAAYRVSEAFVASLAALTEAELVKSFKASVDVLTGMVRTIAGRSLHPLREGSGGNSADVVRADGARCMRVAIEQQAASARRLHYWVLPAGDIELSRVVTHDDMLP